MNKLELERIRSWWELYYQYPLSKAVLLGHILSSTPTRSMRKCRVRSRILMAIKEIAIHVILKPIIEARLSSIVAGAPRVTIARKLRGLFEVSSFNHIFSSYGWDGSARFDMWVSYEFERKSSRASTSVTESEVKGSIWMPFSTDANHSWCLGMRCKRRCRGVSIDPDWTTRKSRWPPVSNGPNGTDFGC